MEVPDWGGGGGDGGTGDQYPSLPISGVGGGGANTLGGGGGKRSKRKRHKAAAEMLELAAKVVIVEAGEGISGMQQGDSAPPGEVAKSKKQKKVQRGRVECSNVLS